MKFKRYILILLFIPEFLSAQGFGGWTYLPVFSGGKRDDAIGFSINGYGYVGTGRDDGFNCRNDFYRYDPENAQWTSISPLPGVPRQYAAAFVVQNRAYVFGGVDCAGNFLNDLYEYNPNNDSWTMKASLPDSGRASSAAFSASVNDLHSAIIIGGRMGAWFFDDVWKYIPDEDRWEKMNDFPGGNRNEMMAVKINGRYFAGMGTTMLNECKKDWYEYSYVSDSWILRSAYPGNNCQYGLAFTGGLIGTGMDTAFNLSPEMYLYEPFSDSWQIKTPFLKPIKGMAGFELNDYWYFTTGIDAFSVRQDSTRRFDYNNYSTADFVVDFHSQNNAITFYSYLPVGEQYSLTCASVTGQIVYRREIAENERIFTVEIPSLQSGIYFYSVYNSEKKVQSGKWIVY